MKYSKKLQITMLIGLLFYIGVTPGYALIDNTPSIPEIEIQPGSVQNNPMTENLHSLKSNKKLTQSSGFKIYGWPEIDYIHTNGKYVSVHGWWKTTRNDLKHTKASVTSILMVKKWYGYVHIGNSNTSSATRHIYPNQTSKRSNARSECKNNNQNTFWAMTILSGNGIVKNGTKSNAPITLNCSPK